MSLVPFGWKIVAPPSSHLQRPFPPQPLVKGEKVPRINERKSK
jgi:hypothetical protein